jgi:hypothetical protein
MTNPSHTLSAQTLETDTTLSLRREPACFAFLCRRAVLAPMPIDAINLDVASLDYFAGRASLWATLEVRAAAIGEHSVPVLGFDEAFLRPFTRALLAAATTRERYHMTILRDGAGKLPQRVVDYVTAADAPLRDLVVTPRDSVLDIAAAGEEEETLFQLPRTDGFLRAFVEMSFKAERALRDTLLQMERLARRRASPERQK